MDNFSIFTTHGALSWVELITDEPNQALTFYQSVMGWETKTALLEGEDGQPMAYHLLIADHGYPIGGIAPKCEKTQYLPTAWNAYITVNCVQETLEKATQHGAHIIWTPKSIPDVGTIAAFTDINGVMISIIQYHID